MTIAINPTTTIQELQRNNTSAADSFPGWPNGIAKAANVSNEPFPGPQKVFAHRCDWYDTNIVMPDGSISARTNKSHPDIGIRSYDPVYCAKTVAAMKSQHLAGALLDWYGPGSSEDKSLLVMRPEFEKQGLQFAICADKGIHGLKYDALTTDAQRTTVLLTALAYARKTYFNSPMYLKDGGKFVILFFGFSTADFDWLSIRKALFDCKLIFRWEFEPKQYSDRPYADGYFGWTNVSEAWLANVKSHAPGKLIFGGLNAYFNNTDLTVCPWGKDNPKVIDSRGGLRLQEQLVMWALHPEVPYLSLNTYTDYPEGSALEPGLASGKTITLTHTNGLLDWNAGGLAFDHCDVYVSRDGASFMLMAEDEAFSLRLQDYDLAPGTYYFLVRAIGKPFVQNILSNTVSATLSWK